MINPGVVEKHAQLVGALWKRRCSAVRSPEYTLKDLAVLDQRVEANLDALSIAGSEGIATCEAALPRDTRQGMFVGTYLAQRAGAAALLENLVQEATSSDEAAQGLLDALGFLSWVDVSALLTRWLSSSERSVQTLALSAVTEHRKEPEAVLDGEWPVEPAIWLERAARAVGHSGLSRRLASVYPLLEHPDRGARFQAAVSVVQLRGSMRERALAIVDEAAQDAAHPEHSFAVRFSIRARDAEAPSRYYELRSRISPQLRHLAAAAAGTVKAIEELVGDCQDPKLSRSAANAFALVTGVDLAYADLEGSPPAAPTAQPAPREASREDDLFTELERGEESADDDDDPSEGLMWADGPKLAAWWSKEKGRFAADQRYLGGYPVGADGARKVLGAGSQQARYEAAWELALRERAALINTLAPGRRQLSGS